MRFHTRILYPLAASLLVCGTAAAQTPGDVANQIANIAVEVITLDRVPWVIGLDASAAIDRGEPDTTAMRGTAFGVRETKRITYGAYLTATRQTSEGTLNNERYGVNMAVAYGLTPRWYLMGIEQWNRAPFNLIRWQNVVAGLGVYEPPARGKLQFGFYGGVGVTSQELTIDLPREDRNFSTVQAGMVTRYPLPGGAGFTGLGSWAAQIGRSGNHVTSGELAIDTRLAGALGLQTTYAVAHDHEPIAGREGTNQSLTVSVTLTLVGREPKRPAAK
jgi:putative salt-induced outer membrane protein YdiY